MLCEKILIMSTGNVKSIAKGNMLSLQHRSTQRLFDGAFFLYLSANGVKCGVC